MSAIVKVVDPSGVTSNIRWRGRVPNFTGGGLVTGIGEVTWSSGERAQIAEFSVDHPLTRRIPQLGWKVHKYVIWVGEPYLKVGDEVKYVLSSGWHNYTNEDEFFGGLEKIAELHESGSDRLSPEEDAKFLEKIR